MNLKLSIMALFVVCLSSVVGGVSHAADYHRYDGVSYLLEHEMFAADSFYIGSVGCELFLACANPGAPTEVEVGEGGAVGTVYLRHTASFLVSAGTVNDYIHAYHAGYVGISGGNLLNDLYAYDNASVWIGGGNLSGDLYAYSTSLIEIEGRDFAVNDVPVALGEIDDLTGVLTGTLTSGESIDTVFYHAGALEGSVNGTIVLVPEPGLHAMQAAALILLLCLSRGLPAART